MPVSEEDQVKAMLEAMGVDSISETAPAAEPKQKTEPVLDVVAAVSAESISSVDLSSVNALLERRSSGGSSQGREMSLSSLVHLLGLATSVQVSLLETKLDAIATKVSTILLKLDRISTDLAAVKSDATVDRIDFQLSDIRALLKRMAPVGIAGAESNDQKPDTNRSVSSKAKILTSENPKPSPSTKPETKIVEKDNLEEFDASPTDAAFQESEGQRIRNQNTK